MENFICNPFEKGFAQLVTLETLFSKLELEPIRSLDLFLPNYTAVDPLYYSDYLKRLMQYCRLISNQNCVINHKQILNESGIFLTPQLTFNEVRFIRQGIQVIVEFVLFCKKQVFWISVNQNEQIVFVN